jgi:hypothetical protein
MNNSEHAANAKKDDTPGQSEVSVTLDGIGKQIHRGAHTVTELKGLLGVDALLAIDEIIDGNLTPLADDAKVTIKGGEVFFSHARTGGAS